MSKFCSLHRRWLLREPDACLDLWYQLARADAQGAFNTPDLQTQRWHAALELVEFLLEQGHPAACLFLDEAESVIATLPKHWRDREELLYRLETVQAHAGRLRPPEAQVCAVWH